MTRRIVVIAMVILYVAFGLVGVIFLAPNTFAGADYATYQRAADSLWQHGDPYLGSVGAGYNFQYRYPPFLALIWPLVGFAPLWWALLGLSTAFVFYLWYRDAGWFGLLPVIMLAGAWGQPLVNGNVQPILMALLALVPFYRRVGAVALAAGTMLKLHPVLGVVWYAGRRDWRSLGWYAGAMGVLAAIQLPWLGHFLHYYTTNPDSSPTAYEGFGLRLFGDIPWLVVTAILALIAFQSARGRLGWFANLVFQLVALPRLLPTNLALVLSSPFQTRRRRLADAIAPPKQSGETGGNLARPPLPTRRGPLGHVP